MRSIDSTSFLCLRSKSYMSFFLRMLSAEKKAVENKKWTIASKMKAFVSMTFSSKPQEGRYANRSNARNIGRNAQPAPSTVTIPVPMNDFFTGVQGPRRIHSKNRTLIAMNPMMPIQFGTMGLAKLANIDSKEIETTQFLKGSSFALRSELRQAFRNVGKFSSVLSSFGVIRINVRRLKTTTPSAHSPATVRSVPRKAKQTTPHPLMPIAMRLQSAARRNSFISGDLELKLFNPAPETARRDSRTRLEAPRSAHSGMHQAAPKPALCFDAALNEIRGFLGGRYRADKIKLSVAWRRRRFAQALLGAACLTLNPTSCFAGPEMQICGNFEYIQHVADVGFGGSLPIVRASPSSLFNSRGALEFPHIEPSLDGHFSESGCGLVSLGDNLADKSNEAGQGTAQSTEEKAVEHDDRLRMKDALLAIIGGIAGYLVVNVIFGRILSKYLKF